MNKRRIWATSPVYYVMAAVMFIMACFSYTQNKILFAVEITVSGLCLAAVIMTDLHYRVHVYTALRAARKVLSADEQRNLGQFALPLLRWYGRYQPGCAVFAGRGYSLSRMRRFPLWKRS